MELNRLFLLCLLWLTEQSINGKWVSTVKKNLIFLGLAGLTLLLYLDNSDLGRFGPCQFGPYFIHCDQFGPFNGQNRPREIRSQITKSPMLLRSQLTKGQDELRSELTMPRMDFRSELCREMVQIVHNSLLYMSCIVRKPAFCICENKDADQLRGNPEADQRLCFRYMEGTIPLLPKVEISSL